MSGRFPNRLEGEGEDAGSGWKTKGRGGRTAGRPPPARGRDRCRRHRAGPCRPARRRKETGPHPRLPRPRSPGVSHLGCGVSPAEREAELCPWAGRHLCGDGRRETPVLKVLNTGTLCSRSWLDGAFSDQDPPGDRFGFQGQGEIDRP